MMNAKSVDHLKSALSSVRLALQEASSVEHPSTLQQLVDVASTINKLVPTSFSYTVNTGGLGDYYKFDGGDHIVFGSHSSDTISLG